MNSYLAQRDAEWMGTVFDFLGLGVDVIDRYDPGTPERRAAYEADITYGTNNEFGFDYLRDNMVHQLEQRVQREHSYAIIDEVDSILVDEARTPLIISSRQTDHLEKEHRLVNYAAAIVRPGGTLYLAHVESRQAFDRYLDAISKIPTIDTEDARRRLELIIGRYV